METLLNGTIEPGSLVTMIMLILDCDSYLDMLRHDVYHGRSSLII